MEICIKWTLCRTCTADTSAQLQPLFDDARLAKQLREYAGIVAKPEDGLPDQICTDCIQNLQSVHTFLMGCRRADAHLRNVVRRTMSSGRCFPSISLDEDTDSSSPSKVGRDARAPKPSISHQQKKRFKTQLVKSLLAEQETPQPETIEAQQLSDEDLSSCADNKNEMLELIAEKHTVLEKLADTSEKNDEDYLLVVSKCVLNLTEGEATDNEGNEYIITDVADNEDDDDDHDYRQHDSYAAEAEAIEPESGTPAVKRLAVDSQPDAEGKSALKLERLQMEEPASAVASLTVDLGAACEPSSFPRHSCSMCGNSFPNQTQLKSHLRTHRNEKNYECELCSKRFNAACNLTTHMRTHTGEKPYECAHCGRRFADRSTHRKHERMHTNERPYACDICAKTFSLSTTLKAHALSHSKEKPHKCLTCNKGFRLPHQLKAHERTHVHRYEVGIMLYNQDEGDYSSS
ncbi:zinc finger protein with KRAB and SCAN domains 1 [Drosophila novamexicana]|uniref:zinc finger protein with KRAB and SCAN domains 1 n=1 Tax=Drosophila novamexicana TaxID=47314 RepID=UPI0011E5907E|nr:zinc finger protein with KRAB and SCAN domains 1 [Drosophila novamexicana]